MAISWGSWVNNSTGNGMRVGYDFSQSPSSVGTGTTSVTVTVEVWVETKASVSDSTNSVSIGGDFSWSGDVSISHGSGGGTTKIRTLSKTVSTSYTGTRTTDVSVSLSGINAIPGTATASGSHTTARRPYNAPKAPTGVSLALSGDHGVVRWTRNPTSSAPYDELELNFQRNDGSWEPSAALSGGATSYTTSTFSKNTTYQYRVRARNSAGTSSWAYSNSVKTPANPPAAPSNVQVARSSDTRQVVSWTRASSTTTAPVSQYEIARRDVYGSGTYITIATVGSSVSSFTDSSTKANKQYQYRVRSKNSSATSSWQYTDYVSTTPNPPTNVKAQKKGQDIQLSWTNTQGTRITSIEIWLTEAGVDLSPVYLRIDGQPTSWTHVNPDPTKTWAYRLKTQSGMDTNDVAPNLYSQFSARSNTVQLIAPPGAPTKLAPSATAADAQDDQTFTWQHNPIDTTDQTAYELQYRIDGGPWTGTGKITSPTSARDYPAGTFENGTTLEWQVRTWGDHTDPSTWSALAVVSWSARPSVTILSPDGSEGVPVILSSTVTAQWAYFDPEETTQTAVRLRLDDANGAPVWSQSLQMASTDYEIPYVLTDGGQYTLVVAVRDAAGLWSYEASQVFDVTYARPPAPVIDASFDLSFGGMMISFEHPEPGPTEAEATSADLQHSADGEEWTTIAAGLDPTTSTVDYIPVLDTVNYYRVISYSDMPSSLESAPVPIMVQSKGWVFVNGGPDWSFVCMIRDNVKTSSSFAVDQVLNQFAGRTFPVMTSGEARSREFTVSGRTSGGGSTAEQWKALMDLAEPVCFREPGPGAGGADGAGDRFMASFQAFSRSRERIFEDVSLSFTQVEEV